MKHLKEFESWTTTASGNVDVNYGDKKPEYSDVVKFIVQYIEDEFDRIKIITASYKAIEFADTNINDISRIELQYKDNIPSILFCRRQAIGNKYDYMDISKDEYDFLINFLFKTEIKRRKINQISGKDEIIDIIDPTKRTAKKYNL